MLGHGLSVLVHWFRMAVLIKLLHVDNPWFVLLVVFMEPPCWGDSEWRVYKSSHQADVLVSDLASLHIHRVHWLRDWLYAKAWLCFIHWLWRILLLLELWQDTWTSVRELDPTCCLHHCGNSVRCYIWFVFIVWWSIWRLELQPTLTYLSLPHDAWLFYRWGRSSCQDKWAFLVTLKWLI